MYIEKKKQQYFNDYMDRLIQHPYQSVNKTREFGRHKQIRRAVAQGMIHIKQGSIAIPQDFKIIKTQRGWRIIQK